MARRKGPTLKDLSAHLGMGTTTISDILSRNKTNYAAETVDKVKQAAEELGYRPNLAARNFRSGKTKTIGVLTSFDITNPFISKIVTTIESRLDKEGYMCLLSLSDQDSDKNQRTMRSFESGQVDGVLAGPVYNRYSIFPRKAQFKSTLPTVFFLSPDDTGPYTVDNGPKQDGWIGATVTQHFLNKGHTRIGYLMSPDGARVDEGNAPLRGMYETLEPKGLFNPDWIWTEQDANADNGYRLMKSILAKHAPADLPTAFFVHNDYSVPGVLAAIQEAGLSCPEDISVIGCDDAYTSRFLSPALTTIQKNPEDIANQAVDLLFTVLENPDHPDTHLSIPSVLVERNSVHSLS